MLFLQDGELNCKFSVNLITWILLLPFIFFKCSSLLYHGYTGCCCITLDSHGAFGITKNCQLAWKAIQPCLSVLITVIRLIHQGHLQIYNTPLNPWKYLLQYDQFSPYLIWHVAYCDSLTSHHLILDMMHSLMLSTLLAKGYVLCAPYLNNFMICTLPHIFGPHIRYKMDLLPSGLAIITYLWLINTSWFTIQSFTFALSCLCNVHDAKNKPFISSTSSKTGMQSSQCTTAQVHKVHSP